MTENFKYIPTTTEIFDKTNINIKYFGNILHTNSPGAYIIIDKSGRKYIGNTLDLESRIYTHKSKRSIDELFVYEVENKTFAEYLEAYLIWLINPELNKVFPETNFFGLLNYMLKNGKINRFHEYIMNKYKNKGKIAIRCLRTYHDMDELDVLLGIKSCYDFDKEDKEYINNNQLIKLEKLIKIKTSFKHYGDKYGIY